MQFDARSLLGVLALLPLGAGPGEHSASSSVDSSPCAVAPVLQITEPTAGVHWSAGATYQIRWQPNPQINELTLELVQGRATVLTIATVPGAAASYDWTIPTEIPSGSNYRIRAAFNRPGCPRATYYSNDDLTICGTAEVLSPNGGEAWPTGTTRNITWSPGRIHGPATVSLYKNGQLQSTLGTADGPGGHFDWLICDSTPVGFGYQIQISGSNGCEPVDDLSDAGFSIVAGTPMFAVISPNFAEEWEIGSEHLILWTPNVINGVATIELCIGLDPIGTIAEVDGATGRFPWTIDPGCFFGPGSNYRIQVRGTAACGPVIDRSDGSFLILPNPDVQSFRVLNPNGGESWEAGSTHRITWTPNVAVYQQLFLFRNEVYVGQIGEGDGLLGYFDWTICPDLPAGDNYRIDIFAYDQCGNSLVDQSDQPFTVYSNTSILELLSPNGGENWHVGSTHAINWSPPAPGDSFRIELLRAGSTLFEIATVDGSVTSFDWTLPGCPLLTDGASYQVRVTRITAGCGPIVDVSDTPFTVYDDSPAPTVLSPNGGENWQVGSTQQITWTPAAPGHTFRIDLLWNGDIVWYGLAFVDGSTTSFDWKLPGCPALYDGDHYQIQITTDCGESDISDAPFNILGNPPPPTVLSPNGGENWQVGSSQQITWTPAAPGHTFRIDLLWNGDIVWYGLATVDGSVTSFDWTLPACPLLTNGDNYQIQVSTDCEEGDISAPFTIFGNPPSPTLTITNPQAGAEWIAGTDQTITWTATDPLGNVNIELVRVAAPTQLLGVAPMSAGSFTARICPFQAAFSNYRIRIRGIEPCTSAVSTISPAFRIKGTLPVPSFDLLTPSDGDVLSAGSTMPITWTYDGPSEGTVILRVFGDKPGATIGYVDPEARSFAWPICAQFGDGQYFLEATFSDCNRSIATRSRQIQIINSIPAGLRPALQFTRPAAGDSFIAGTAELVQWTSSGPSGPVDFYAVIDRLTTQTRFLPVGNAMLDSNALVWSVPATLGQYPQNNNALIALFDCGHVSATSSNFHIVPPPPPLSAPPQP